MRREGFIVVLIILFVSLSITFSQEKTATWPKRVLITNDDGIDRVQIIELARAFAKVAETYVVAPLQNQSGTGDHVTWSDTFLVQPRMLGEGIRAYGVPGSPADCVRLALLGIMRDTPPDLVISGINTSPNLWRAWIFSGTIGAARMAAFYGVPAIAVSGLDEKVAGAVEAATNWVVRLAQSDLVRELNPPQFLTVSIPLIPPAEIKGVRVAERREDPPFNSVLKYREYSKQENAIVNKSSDFSSDNQIWEWKFKRQEYRKWRANLKSQERDVDLYNSGYVVVVPMIANEHDYELLTRLKNQSGSLPKWSRQLGKSQ